MKRLICGLLISFFLLNCHIAVPAEEDVLTIAVVSESDARNLPAEEAFFKRYPHAVIEYRLYTEEQLNTILITGTADFDLAILPYQTLLNMAKKGYLTPVDQLLAQDGYPTSLIDLRGLLTIDQQTFALPVSIAQPFLIWDEEIARRAGISMPEEAWTFADYAEYAKKFPQDTDGDGQADTYLMYGSCLPAYPAFHNVNLSMFTQYAAQHADFEVFGAQYLELFREIIISDALLDMESNSDAAVDVLIREASAANPIDILSASLGDDTPDAIHFLQTDEQSGYRFLPPPLLNRQQISYAGSMTACGVLRQAKRVDLAAAFLQGMVSQDALDYGTFALDEQLIASDPPKYLYFDAQGDFTPAFTNQNQAPVYRVRAGRNIPVISFVYTRAAFERSQAFREKLSVDPFLMGRDFYDAAWSTLQEWVLGRMDDAQLVQNMQYLFGIARGVR